jgi:hypothetical protein
MNPPDDATATVESAVRPPPLRTGPILIAFDGTPGSEYALWEAGALLSGRRALVVTVWKPGLAFELMELPTATLGLPPAQLDIRTAKLVTALPRLVSKRSTALMSAREATWLRSSIGSPRFS